MILFQNIFWRTYSGTSCLARVARMLVAFSPSSTSQNHIFYLHVQCLFSVLLYYWLRNAYHFNNLPEMRITFVLLCLMADKHVSTCDTNITLFSVEMNYPDLCLSLPSISNASYSKCSEKSYTLSSLFFRLASTQLCCCNLMCMFCLPPTTYTWAQEKEAVV